MNLRKLLEWTGYLSEGRKPMPDGTKTKRADGHTYVKTGSKWVREKDSNGGHSDGGHQHASPKPTSDQTHAANAASAAAHAGTGTHSAASYQHYAASRQAEKDGDDAAVQYHKGMMKHHDDISNAEIEKNNAIRNQQRAGKVPAALAALMPANNRPAPPVRSSKVHTVARAEYGDRAPATAQKAVWSGNELELDDGSTVKVDQSIRGSSNVKAHVDSKSGKVKIWG